jgi:single-strand DNA-binding protein
MAYDNTVTIVGNLTRDPELRFTPSGQATATFGVAVNRVWTDRQSQERKEATSFLDVVCWGQLAENAAQSLTRGTRVVVSGRLDQRSWENQEGDKRSKIEITADEVSPSLRWATVEITKNERRTPDGNGGGSYGGNGGGNSYGGGNGGGGSSYRQPVHETAPSSGGFSPSDEEPF